MMDNPELDLLGQNCVDDFIANEPEWLDIIGLNKEKMTAVKSDRQQLRTGRWSKEEHQMFEEGLKLFGKDWQKMKVHMKTRSSGQIRSHAQKFFNQMKKLQVGDDSNDSTDEVELHNIP